MDGDSIGQHAVADDNLIMYDGFSNILLLECAHVVVVERSLSKISIFPFSVVCTCCNLARDKYFSVARTFRRWQMNSVAVNEKRKIHLLCVAERER